MIDTQRHYTGQRSPTGEPFSAERVKIRLNTQRRPDETLICKFVSPVERHKRHTHTLKRIDTPSTEVCAVVFLFCGGKRNAVPRSRPVFKRMCGGALFILGERESGKKRKSRKGGRGCGCARKGERGRRPTRESRLASDSAARIRSQDFKLDGCALAISDFSVAPADCASPTILFFSSIVQTSLSTPAYKYEYVRTIYRASILNLLDVALRQRCARILGLLAGHLRDNASLAAAELHGERRNRHDLRRRRSTRERIEDSGLE
ncbi:hypothetical protein HPB51_021185 [Rhipicephalus microplus]|uniref:Uncharacterized protein n=1 Tax=Rhipicephalus microplus TaxID=6941 RepID=A0A9J6F8F6_RHIMP|nr:hypothetical protein HPB51_021185 [Rhipicephalus microplus]